MKELLEKIKAQLLIDKKKTAILGGLSLVLLVVAVRTFSKKAPETTVAAQDLLPPAQPATPTAQPVAPAAAPGTPALTAHAAPPQSNDPSRGKTVSVSGMSRDLERDPFTTPAWSKFVPDLDDFADSTRGSRSSRAPFWSRFARAVSDYRKMRKAEVERLSRELGELSLQSTLTGPFPIAYVSGRLVREGDSLQGFSVFRISDRRVFLQKDGQLYCLAMH